MMAETGSALEDEDDDAAPPTTPLHTVDEDPDAVDDDVRAGRREDKALSTPDPDHGDDM